MGNQNSQESITPTFHHSNTPILQHSITPIFHHSNIPSLQHSIPPILHSSIKKNPFIIINY
ncbi:MAG: hypothetical protein PF484_13990 [Bacteroidales bacterium]|nr:hypothetical protein [Bacteroidales bacterium]